MGEASGMHWDTRDENRIWVGNLRESDHLENIGKYGRIILKWIFKNMDGGSDMAQDRDRWRTLVAAVMNRRVA